MTRLASALLFLGLVCTSAVGAGLTRAIQECPAMQESLRRVPPRLRAGWLRSRGLDDSYYTTYRAHTDSGLRMIGKYGRGPSVEVTGRDSLVFLRLGSEVAIINFAVVDSPRVVAELQLNYVWGQVAVRDTLLITGGNGIDLWSIADPRSPRHVSTLPYAVGDFAMFDTLIHFVSLDTFQTFSIADPAHPYRLGFCPESGYATTATCSTVVLIHGSHLSFVDVSNPSAPHTVGTFAGAAFSATARGGLCCASFLELPGAERTWFLTIDISNPAAPTQLARLDSVFGYDLCLVDTLVFVSGRSAAYPEKFRIVSIADSVHPRVEGTCGVSDYRWGVWANPASGRAFVASEPGGLAVIDISNQSAPVVDTTLMHADLAYDICVDGDRAYVADWRGGLRILDVSNPACPTELGGYDSASIASNTAVASDSFAFVGWYQPPYFLSIDVSNPASPKHVGGMTAQTIPEDLVLRDSFVYLAGRMRFNVINVARPREPVLVGSCVLPGTPGKLVLEDSTAYASTYGVQCMSIADPDSPFVVGTYGTEVTGLDIVDTVVYGAGPYTGLISVSVARPASPRLLDSLYLTDTLWWNDVVVVNSRAYVGGDRIWVADVSNPADLRLVPGVSWTPPYLVRRLFYAAPYIYAACYEAGVCVLETVQVGMSEELSRARLVERPGRVCPNPAYQFAAVRAGPDLESAVMRDVLGRLVRTFKPSGAVFTMDLTGLRPGLYFIELRYNTGRRMEKLIKQ